VVEIAGELRVADVPAYGVGAFVEPGDAVEVERLADGGVRLRNGGLEAVLAPDGSLSSLVDRTSGREALAAPGNVLELYQDQPNAWDAWDVDPYHVKLGEPCPPADGVTDVRASPLRAEVRFERPIGQRSRLTQTVRLDAGARRLEFHTEVEWHEEHRMLKAAFPLAVRSRLATYETAFGVEQRPTHANTSADAARFEVSGHRFADLSEDGFGVALLTDSKYGYSCREHVLRVSLLRSPKAPDAEADMGRHAFVYAVLPHAGSWQDGRVLGEATALNRPLRRARGLAPGSLVAVEGRGLVLDTVKQAESSDALVLRLYEAFGGRGTARVRVAFPIGDVRRATILEDAGEPVERDGEALIVPYSPFEVISLLVEPAKTPSVR
jgi:alpha-mannosidase